MRSGADNLLGTRVNDRLIWIMSICVLVNTCVAVQRQTRRVSGWSVNPLWRQAPSSFVPGAQAPGGCAPERASPSRRDRRGDSQQSETGSLDSLSSALGAWCHKGRSAIAERRPAFVLLCWRRFAGLRRAGDHPGGSGFYRRLRWSLTGFRAPVGGDWTLVGAGGALRALSAAHPSAESVVFAGEQDRRDK